MNNPLIIRILGYLREQNSSCSLLDLAKLCEQDLQTLIAKDVDHQVAIFQKNFFIMNALYQIQRDIQSTTQSGVSSNTNGRGFILNIFPLEISLSAVAINNSAEVSSALTTRDTDLANYYLNWTHLDNITAEEVEALFSSFWQKYSAVDKVDAAFTTLELNKNVSWADIRKAYLKKIAISHPDKGGCTEDFIATREAYEVLSISYEKA